MTIFSTKISALMQLNLVRSLFALILGIFLTLSFAPYYVFPLAIFAPMGLFFLWLYASPLAAFSLGWLFGIGFFGSGVYWVFHSIHVFGGIPNFPAGFITALFIAILALFPALTGFIINKYFSSPSPKTIPIKLIIAMPTIWVCSEWIRSWIFTGFPWLFIGYSQSISPLSGFAPIWGVYGVSLLTLITSGLIANAILQLYTQHFRSTYVSLFCVIIIWILGAIFNLIPWTTASGPKIPISLVQGNIPQALKWSPEHLQLSLDTYADLTRPLWGKSKIIIWPEAAIPMTLQDSSTYIDYMDTRARASHSYLILGIPVQTVDEKGYYNSIIVLGEKRQIYLKRRLVPFGEFIPSLSILSRLFDMLNIPMSNMVPGKFDQFPLVIENTKILPSICYEIAFPELINLNDTDIGILLTITNDAWFGRSSAQAQHLQMAAMRAQEFRRPLIFVSNDGITAILDSYGKIDAAAPQYQAYVLNGVVQARIGKTPWMVLKTDCVLLILILGLVSAIFMNRRARKDGRTI